MPTRKGTETIKPPVIPPEVHKESPQQVKPKHAGGRPKKYQPEEFDKKLTEYLDNCKLNQEPVLITGFALYCDIDRDTIAEYGLIPEYSGVVKKLHVASEQFASKYLYSGKNPAGAIFYLKNCHGWTDKVEQIVTGNVLHRLELPDTKQIDTAAMRLLEDRKQVVQGEFTSVE